MITNLIILYIVGAFITATILSALEDRPEEPSGIWGVSALWPLLVVAIIIMLILGGPIWLGTRIGKKLRS